MHLYFYRLILYDLMVEGQTVCKIQRWSLKRQIFGAVYLQKKIVSIKLYTVMSFCAVHVDRA